jgi:hypothetical protein
MHTMLHKLWKSGPTLQASATGHMRFSLQATRTTTAYTTCQAAWQVVASSNQHPLIRILHKNSFTHLQATAFLGDPARRSCVKLCCLLGLVLLGAWQCLLDALTKAMGAGQKAGNSSSSSRQGGRFRHQPLPDTSEASRWHHQVHWISARSGRSSDESALGYRGALQCGTRLGMWQL